MQRTSPLLEQKTSQGSRKSPAAWFCPALSVVVFILAISCFQSNVFLLSFDKLYSTGREMASKKLLACDFEVFGVVQGVFFRKYTEQQAKSLGVRGWCMNTNDGTVKGQIEGDNGQLNEMKNWLRTKGSPTSRIDKAVFSEAKEIQDYTFPDFTIRR